VYVPASVGAVKLLYPPAEVYLYVSSEIASEPARVPEVLVKVFVITAVVPVYVLLCAADVNVIGRVVTVEVELLVRVGVP
jgi:hypothetical protein